MHTTPLFHKQTNKQTNRESGFVLKKERETWGQFHQHSIGSVKIEHKF
jgi:hypothetical protein